MNDVDSTTEQLLTDVRLLTARVAQLEARLGVDQPRPIATPLPPAPDPLALPDLPIAGTIQTLGKALLGLAGAYLLRAATESGTIAVSLGVAIGIAYSLFWLAFAARRSPQNRPAGILYSITSALILAPLLWEATLRFHALPPWLAAVVLAGFTLFGFAIAWRANLTHIAWIATLTGTLSAAALLLATRDVVPFTCALLLIAAAVEFSASFERWMDERFLVALLLDLSVLFMTWLVSRGTSLPEGYAPIPAWSVIGIQAAMLILYLSSAMARTLWRGRTFTNLEVFQCALASVIGIGGGIRAGYGTTLIAVAFATATLFGGAASYLVSFAFLARHPGRERNFYIYSTFGIVLTIFAGWILLPTAILGAVLPVAAIVCFWIGGRSTRSTLLWHGVLYSLLAAVLSQALPDALRLLLTSATGLDSLNRAAWIAGLGLILCPLVLIKFHTGQPLLIPVTLTAVLIAAGFAAGALTPFAPIAAAGATIRTAVLTAAALALAAASMRWSQPAFAKVAYALMILCAYKIFLQEIGDNQPLALMLSLVLYGATLLLLPKLLARPR